MSDLARHVQDYLRLRRALGYKLAREGLVLPRFVEYLEAAGATTVTTDLAIAWAQLPQGVGSKLWCQRLGSVRGFARYLATFDPTAQVPPAGVFASNASRPAPYQWSQADICRLLEAAHEIRPRFRAATYETLFGLLAVSGLRPGEAYHLNREDVDLGAEVITIRQGKFGRTRLVPLHPSTAAALRSYASCRDGLNPPAQSGTFFVSDSGAALSQSSVHRIFTQLTTGLGLRTDDVHPRMHDLHHSFAVRTLIDWHRGGQDVEARIPALATYLGHVEPASTYWYLSATPELMQLAAHRLGGRFGGQS